MLNLLFHHDVGSGANGPQANNPGFHTRDWEAQGEFVKMKPGVEVGSIDDPPDVTDNDERPTPTNARLGAGGTF